MSLAQIPSRHKKSGSDSQRTIVQEDNLNCFFSPTLINVLSKIKKTIEEYSIAPSIVLTLSECVVVSGILLRPTDPMDKEDNRIALSEALSGHGLLPDMTNVFCTVGIDTEDAAKRTLLVSYLFPNKQAVTGIFPYKIVTDGDTPRVQWNEAAYNIDAARTEIHEILNAFHNMDRSHLIELAVSMRQAILKGHRYFYSREAGELAIGFDLDYTRISPNIRYGDDEKKQKEKEFLDRSQELYGSIISAHIDAHKEFMRDYSTSLEGLEKYIEENILVPSFNI